MPHTPDIPRELSSIHVLIRFVLRMILLGIFATFGSQGFGKTFESLLILAVLYCVSAAAVRREAPFGPILTHFDEAAACAAIGALTSALS
jgi:hypothetical protein